MSGHTAADEMCNLYMMLYSQLPYFGWCLDNKTVVEVRPGWGRKSGDKMGHRVGEAELCHAWTPACCAGAA